VRTVFGATLVTKATVFASAAFVALAGVTAAVVAIAIATGDGTGRPAEVLGAQVSGSSSGSTNGRRPADPGKPDSTGLATRFPISGSITDLVPGQERTLLVQLTNPNPFTVSVNAISVRATAATAGCSVANLSIQPLPAPVLVDGSASGAAGIPIELIATAPDTCQGATFPLTFSAEVTKA